MAPVRQAASLRHIPSHRCVLAAGGHTSLQHLLIDKNATALPADQVAISDQLLVAGNDGIAGDIELSRQFATRWQFHAWRKNTVDDAVYDLLPNLVLEIHRAFWIDINNRCGHRATITHCGKRNKIRA